MNKDKKESYGGWGIFALVAVFLLLLAISFFISISKNVVPAQLTSPIAKEAFSIFLQYGNVFFILIMGGAAILISAIQVHQFRQKSILKEKEFERQKQREKQQSLEEGRRETIKSLASELVSDKDIISELTAWLNENKTSEAKREKQQSLEERRRETIKSLAMELISDKDIISELTAWLNEYKVAEAKIDQSTYIQSQILIRLVKQIHLNPIAKINEIVAFNPDQHRTFDRLKPSEEAVIIEPGWRVGREIIKLPLVRRKS